MQEAHARAEALRQQQTQLGAAGGADATWARDMQQQLSQQEGVLGGLRAENQALQEQAATQGRALHGAQQAAAAAQQAAAAGQARPRPTASFSNKKNEDDEFDVEAAVLTGGRCTCHP